MVRIFWRVCVFLFFLGDIYFVEIVLTPDTTTTATDTLFQKRSRRTTAKNPSLPSLWDTILTPT